MKIWLLRPIIFFSALTFGLVAGFSSFFVPPALRTAIQTNETQKIVATPPVIAEKDDFIPEFRDLPTFDELFPDEPIARASDEKLIDILDDGIYRRDEVVAKNGESWLVLVNSANKLHLRQSTAKVQKRKSVSWPGDVPDAKLSFNVPGKPVIALKDIRGLKPGPVTTLFQRGVWEESDEKGTQHEEMSTGYRREFTLNDTKYVLRTSLGLTKDNVKVAVLVLESDGVNQVLVQKYHVESDDRDIIGSLLWAGDLDGDGKLDLYFDDFNEKGYFGTELHMSSYASPNKLVGFAASFGTAGC